MNLLLERVERMYNLIEGALNILMDKDLVFLPHQILDGAEGC